MIGACLEVAAIVVAAAVSLRWPLAAVVVLLAAGSLSRWARGRGWVEDGRGSRPLLTLIGAGLGVVALTAALLLAAPALEELTARSIDWTPVATVRGNLGVLLVLATVVVAQAIATELALRRWVLERVHDLGARAQVAAVAAAVVEGAISGGHPAARAGAALLGLGLGLLYVAAGRRLAPAIACRVSFELGALILVWARLI